MVTTPSEAQASIGGSLDNIPKTKDEALAKKNALKVVPGSQTSLAMTLGIPADLANMFFVKLGDQMYIKVAGLEFLAGKQGVGRIEVSDHYDSENETWVAEAKVYPKIGPREIEAISKLPEAMQKIAFEELTKPTNGIGQANKNNIKMSTMIPFAREMAQTRAKGRALRAFTHYGATSYEELPEAEIKVE
jgi:hypothetical protein